MNYPKIKKDLINTYDHLADNWVQDKKMRLWGYEDIEKFANITGKGSRVLDLGCGSGVQSQQLSKLGLNVIGIDISPKMIKIAKKLVPEAQFKVADIINLNFEKEYFNGVYARASLLHIPKKYVPKVLESLYKLLIKNGLLYLALKIGEGEKILEDIKYGTKVKRYFSLFEEKEIRELLGNAGFKVDSISFSKDTDRDVKWMKIFTEKK